ncbi:unnamed protein product, partial [Tilletia laevis]
MEHVCEHCLALHWISEKTSGSMCKPKFGTCCSNGNVVLPQIFDCPPTLQALYTSGGDVADQFRRNIRDYNNAFAFLSFGGTRDLSVAGQRGIYTFKVKGQVHHRIGGLVPEDGFTPSYAQVYFVATDPAQATGIRASRPNTGLQPNTLDGLQRILWDVNPFVEALRSSKTMLDHLATTETEVGIRIIHPGAEGGPDPRTYNLPRASEVAAIVFDRNA